MPTCGRHTASPSSWRERGVPDRALTVCIYKQLTREMAVILLEQHIELALEVAGHAYVMDRGHIALAGPATTVKSDPQLMRYLAP